MVKRWKDMGTEPYCNREDEEEEVVKFTQGGGLEKLLTLNVVVVVEGGKWEFYFCWLLQVQAEKLSPLTDPGWSWANQLEKPSVPPWVYGWKERHALHEALAGVEVTCTYINTLEWNLNSDFAAGSSFLIIEQLGGVVCTTAWLFH